MLLGRAFAKPAGRCRSVDYCIKDVFVPLVPAATVVVCGEYTRRDIAHERFDCDWQRDCGCMVNLLDALGCATEAAELRAFCQAKGHVVAAGGSRLHSHCEHSVIVIVKQFASLFFGTLL